jgi:hypothetical protein
MSICPLPLQAQFSRPRGASFPSRTNLPSETNAAISSAEWEESDGHRLSWVCDRSVLTKEC